MASTTFVHGTVIEPEWLNDVNTAVYDPPIYINTALLQTQQADLSGITTGSYTFSSIPKEVKKITLAITTLDKADYFDISLSGSTGVGIPITRIPQPIEGFLESIKIDFVKVYDDGTTSIKDDFWVITGTAINTVPVGEGSTSFLVNIYSYGKINVTSSTYKIKISGAVGYPLGGSASIHYEY
jgi:hypothetical protein